MWTDRVPTNSTSKHWQLTALVLDTFLIQWWHHCSMSRQSDRRFVCDEKMRRKEGVLRCFSLSVLPSHFHWSQKVSNVAASWKLVSPTSIRWKTTNNTYSFPSHTFRSAGRERKRKQTVYNEICWALHQSNWTRWWDWTNEKGVMSPFISDTSRNRAICGHAALASSP